jgi:hypothetical protein
VQLPDPQLGPGPVELGVTAEISDLAADARPGLAQAALAMARILDHPTAVNQTAGSGEGIGRAANPIAATAAPLAKVAVATKLARTTCFQAPVR